MVKGCVRELFASAAAAASRFDDLNVVEKNRKKKTDVSTATNSENGSWHSKRMSVDRTNANDPRTAHLCFSEARTLQIDHVVRPTIISELDSSLCFHSSSVLKIFWKWTADLSIRSHLQQRLRSYVKPNRRRKAVFLNHGAFQQVLLSPSFLLSPYLSPAPPASPASDVTA